MQLAIFQRMTQIQAAVQAELLTKRNVVGVGVGNKEANGVMTDTPAIIVLVEQKAPSDQLGPIDAIPREIAGVRTDVLEVGRLEAQQTGNRSRQRPVIAGGASIGHFKITAGTFGVLVFDRVSGQPYLLSNNHVLANSNEAQIGDPILQPGPLDGGQNPSDVVARLERFIPLNYIEGPVGVQPTPNPTQPPTPKPTPVDPDKPPAGSGCDVVNVATVLLNSLAKIAGSDKRVTATSVTAQAAPAKSAPVSAAEVQAQVADNTLDAALARPDNPAMFDNDIASIGAIKGTKAPSIGMAVRKMGRTTGLTQGTITVLNATVTVAYNTSVGQRTARFTGQVIASGMSQGGDSGSLVVAADDDLAVGLLFAGSGVATIFTPIDNVLATLGVRF